MATVHKFELMCGAHSVSDGNYIYAAPAGTPPTVVIGTDRLDLMFGETKFKYLGDVEVPADPGTVVPVEDKKAKK